MVAHGNGKCKLDCRTAPFPASRSISSLVPLPSPFALVLEILHMLLLLSHNFWEEIMLTYSPFALASLPLANAQLDRDEARPEGLRRRPSRCATIPAPLEPVL